MGFWLNFFKSGSKTVTNSGSATGIAVDSSKYANWNKEKLIKRIIELESVESNDVGISKKRKNDEETVTGKSSKKSKKKKPREFDFSQHNTRFIALKFAYLGWNYNGLALQKEATKLPTVESILLDAMNKCKLVPSMVPQDFKFSRCGRTDKGVSAMSQVVSLNVRSNLTDDEQMDPINDSKELDYAHILNQQLPNDIRVSAVALRLPEDFDARFSCKSRHYKYLFSSKGLDLEKMQEAAKLFEGENDFRNFCKLDGSKQITNYHRNVISSNIMKYNDKFYCFDLIGSAFLWHQVRCMMANLFLVGQGLEEITMISNMLNIEITPQKPIYDMANDLPLILFDCDFDCKIEWLNTNVNDFKSVKYGKAVDALKLNYDLKASLTQLFEDSLPSQEFSMRGKTRINTGDGLGRIVSRYQKMGKRDVMASVDVVNAKFKRKQENKKLDNSQQS
ncbi:similar to Saccharomyces cerevisiae YFL001W DEG1 tRNA:pseudouridine synthase [Maudiozyma saulgeensis]|uniref:Similar to Saccharomyces cerevisiae YFL001W DEG1 tRNA:pseudouridine synthase n=1 Tax=Maudiozyma saulgeensis TaxID=1789683 RepID=A0A1X7R0R4_9SACH|nr:similar to Saccharomyces cerevisiae YFL001W DEG1 tRNA:pseudouridine synthase [Kazachstania saulgeensis]